VGGGGGGGILIRIDRMQMKSDQISSFISCDMDYDYYIINIFI